MKRTIGIIVIVLILIGALILIYYTQQKGTNGNRDVKQAKKDVSFAQGHYDKAYSKYIEAREEALGCKEKRDAVKFGLNKNKSCHIDKLTKLNDEWDKRSGVKDKMLNILNKKKQILLDAEKALASTTV